MEENDMEKYCEKPTTRGTRCTKLATVGKICLYHHKLEQKRQHIKHDGETQECTCKSHDRQGSLYSKKAVPIEKFSEGNKKYKYCIECRIFKKKEAQETKNRKIELEKKEANPDTKICKSACHDVEGVSKYPKNAVPKEMFQYTVKMKKEESDSCSDCRKHVQKLRNKNKEKILEEMNDDEFYCVRCKCTHPKENRGLDKHGEDTGFCKECLQKTRIASKERKKFLKALYRSIQREMMEKSKCSCQMCKAIILKPVEGTKYAVELPTYEENGDRYVNYKGTVYQTLDFMKKFEHLLEYRVLELDHLNEKEQRERGIISENEEFIKKRERVSHMENEKDMRQEARITQNLCCRCHVIITIAREKGTIPTNLRVLEIQQYIQKLKGESGCECCGFKDKSLTRYLEFDHLDPCLKIASITDMITLGYSLQQIIEEIKKCRILCKSCHKIHTDEQRQQKII